MTVELTIYLTFHAIITVGAIFVFFLRIEHRLTKVETKVESLEKKVGLGCQAPSKPLEKNHP